MPSRSYRHPLIGEVRFETKNKTKWETGDDITFTKGFDVKKNIKTVVILQLAKVPGANGGSLEFHVRAHQQLKDVFNQIEKDGLLGEIMNCDGTSHQRLKKPTSGVLSTEPSEHAFGLAIDLNTDDDQLGLTVARLAPIFEKFGFRWGITFKDPMHFEVKSFADDPATELSYLDDYRLLHPQLLNQAQEAQEKLAEKLQSKGLTLDPVCGYRPADAGAVPLAHNFLPSLAADLGLFSGDVLITDPKAYAFIAPVIAELGLSWSVPGTLPCGPARVEIPIATLPGKSMERGAAAEWQTMLKALTGHKGEVDGVFDPPWPELLNSVVKTTERTPMSYLELFQAYMVWRAKNS